MKRQLTEWENIFASHTSDKRFVPRVHKELLQLNNTMANNTSKKCTRDLNREFSKEDIQMSDERMLHSINHQENANQSHNEMPLHMH